MTRNVSHGTSFPVCSMTMLRGESTGRAWMGKNLSTRWSQRSYSCV